MSYWVFFLNEISWLVWNGWRLIEFSVDLWWYEKLLEMCQSIKKYYSVIILVIKEYKNKMKINYSLSEFKLKNNRNDIGINWELTLGNFKNPKYDTISDLLID